MSLTQMTTILMSLNIIHSYYKQNTILFIAWLSLYTTSIIYHFTKYQYPLELRTNRFIFILDVACCVFVYLGALYNFYIYKIPKPYSTYIYLSHFSWPIIFIPAAYFNIMMWDKDQFISEIWHAMFHLVVYIESHMFLYFVKN